MMRAVRLLLATVLLITLTVGCSPPPTRPTAISGAHPTQATLPPTATVGRPGPSPTVVAPTAVAGRHPGWTTYTNGNRVSSLLLQGTTLWAGTSGGVVVWDTRNGTYRKLTTDQGLGDNQVRDVAVCADGTLWFGTTFGTSRLGPDGRWQSFTTRDGLAKGEVSAVAVAPDGAPWFGARGGASRLGTDGSWQSVTKQDGLPDDSVYAITVAPDGALWFGTWGVSRYQESR